MHKLFGNFQANSRCFPKILQDRRSRRSRQISSLGLPCLYFSGLVGGNFEVGSCFAALGQIWGQSAIRSVNSYFACLGGRGWGAWGGCNCANRCSPESRLGGKRWLEPKRPTPQPADQATRYLAQIYWPPPCALPNLNNFAKAHKAFCRFWCLGLQDANIGVLQFRREGGGGTWSAHIKAWWLCG